LPEQANLNACGPAAITHLFIKRKPDDFVQFATDLYDNGSARFGSLTVSGNGLFSKDPAAMAWGGQAPDFADWMIFSSLRRSKDHVIRFGGDPSDAASAITLPGDIEDWVRDGIGYSEVKNEANKFFTKGLAHLRNLQTELDKDILLLINVSNVQAGITKGEQKKQLKSQGISGKTQAAFPNHYVVLEKPVETANGNIKATVWTWGQTGYVLQAPEHVWKDNYYGAILCTV
jgi:hypothetical protein